jgi:PTS system nitrogen regulatory IIA component
VAQRAAKLTGLDERAILDTLLQRERLGSTGIGRGIAIPHGRVQGLQRIVSVFARLEDPIEFEALDDEPVDLIFLLLAPEHAGADHLKALARISRVLREPASIDRLRASRDRATIYSVLTEPAVHAA